MMGVEDFFGGPELPETSVIKTNEKPNEKRIVLVRTIDLFLSISPKSFPVIYEI